MSSDNFFSVFLLLPVGVRYAYGIICTFALSCCMIVLLAQYVYLFKYVHKSSYKLYQWNPWDSLIIWVYNMCPLDVSFIKYKYVKCCSVRMRLCLIRICVHFLFRTASWGDAPNWPYSYSIRVIGHVCACSVLLHSKCPVQSHALYRWRAAVGTLRPTETAAMTVANAPGESPVHESCWPVLH